jgi:hypothetical protein
MMSLGVIGPPQSEQGSISGIFESESEPINTANSDTV